MGLRHNGAVRGYIVQVVIETASTFRADLDPFQRPERSGKSRLHVIADFLIPKQKKAVC
jgi:hypothetical protein